MDMMPDNLNCYAANSAEASQLSEIDVIEKLSENPLKRKLLWIIFNGRRVNFSPVRPPIKVMAEVWILGLSVLQNFGKLLENLFTFKINDFCSQFFST